MKKLILSLFFLFNLTEYCSGLDKYNKNLEALKKEINEVFEIKDEKQWQPIYLISVTRTTKKKDGSTTANPIIGNSYKTKMVLQKVKNEINEYFDGINKYFEDKGGHKIIAFNEMFFSKTTPLNSDPNDSVTHDDVMNYTAAFNKAIPNSIVFCNLLYTENNREVNFEDASYLYALTLFRHENKGFTTDASTLKKAIPYYLYQKIDEKFSKHIDDKDKKSYQNIVNKYVKSYITVGNKDTFSKDKFRKDIGIVNKYSNLNTKLNFLINKTYCIYGGKPIFSYKKSSYYKENDSLIKDGYVYDLGDGYPTISGENLTNETVKRIFNTISTEICMDFVCGIRKNNNWKSTRENSPSSKLHIIQSNSVNAWAPKKRNYPVNIPILYSDANNCFPNFRMGLGGVTCCLDLPRDKQHIIKNLDKQATLFNKVAKISWQEEFDSNSYYKKNGYKDYYDIWIYKL